MILKLILKNLWARRRRNAWLLAELILVTVLTWYITDPVFVLSYNRSLPLGYNPDGLLIAQLNNLPSKASGYSEEESDSLHTMQNLQRLLQELRNHPDVQCATTLITFAYPASDGMAMSSLMYDTIEVTSNVYYFLPHSGYFETFGFRGVDGKIAQELDNMDFENRDLILTEDLVRRLTGGTSLTGKRFFNPQGNDTLDYRIRATIEKVRTMTFEQGMGCRFEPQLRLHVSEVESAGKLLFRLRPGVSEQRFLHEFRPWARKHLRAGNLYVRNADNFQQQIDQREYEWGVTNKYRMNVALAIFFLTNLALGVTGTFWLQTRSRREEVGVLLSYGASPNNIVRLLMGEAAVLATVAWIIGCFAYLQYGISEGNWFQQGEVTGDLYWINNFSLHFIAVSLIVYVIILTVVLVGVYIPARSISRIPPTEALRDE